MDSMIFDPSAGDPVRTTSSDGGVYRTTVGPAYYESSSNFPPGTKFVSTLNFGNDSLDMAHDMAVASVKYQSDKISYFELGNEPTNYDQSRFHDSTKAYVKEWKDWTSQIDAAVDQTAGGSQFGASRWWASSATTDKTGLNVRPVDIIPFGIDSNNQVAEYSIRSYAFATCNPERAALATIPNILNHTGLISYADTEIEPSALAALKSGKPWVIGEFNNIACSAAPGVSDAFAGALWTVDVELIYAVRNASSVHLHQGATLGLQSSDQVNSAGKNGEPGYSTYDMLYLRDTKKRGKARALPSFVAQLFMAEAFGTAGTKVRAIETPEGVNPEHFSAYAFYNQGRISKMAVLNIRLFYETSSHDHTVHLDFSEHCRGGKAWVKRMTAPHVDSKDGQETTWAGQHFIDGSAKGQLDIEEAGSGGIVKIRGSEAVLVFFNESEVYWL